MANATSHDLAALSEVSLDTLVPENLFRPKLHFLLDLAIPGGFSQFQTSRKSREKLFVEAKSSSCSHIRSLFVRLPKSDCNHNNSKMILAWSNNRWL